MEDHFVPLDNDEVLFISVGRVLMTNPTFKVGEFIDALAQAISDREAEWAEENEGWFGEGLECESLRFQSNGWQKGRVRIRLEFCPDRREPKLLATHRAAETRRAEPSNPRYEEVYRPDRESLPLDDPDEFDDDP